MKGKNLSNIIEDNIIYNVHANMKLYLYLLNKKYVIKIKDNSKKSNNEFNIELKSNKNTDKILKI